MAYESRLSLTVDSRTGERNLRRLQGELGQTERQGVQSFNKLRTLALGFAGVLGTIGAGRALKGVIDEQELLQRNMLRTTQLIKTTGREAETSAQRLMEQARGIARATLQSTEGVMQAQQTLLTFRNITGETFDLAIDGAVDLASSMGIDLNSAVLQLGKALEDPVTGMTALTRSGTVFTQAQKDMVKEMVSTNRTAEAQQFILGELEAQYGGTARAEAEGLAGAQDTLGQAFQEGGIAIADYLDLGERASSFYLSIANGVDSLAESLEAGDLDGHIENVTTAAEALAILAAGRLSASLLTSAGSFAAAQVQAIRYQAALASMAGISRTAAASQAALGVAARGAAGAMALLGGPVGAAIVAGGAIYYFREELGLTSTEALTAAGAVDQVTEAMQGLNLEAQRGFVEDLQRQFSEAESVAESLEKRLEKIDRPGNQGGVSGNIISQLRDDLNEAEIKAGNLEKQLAAGVEQLEGFEEAGKKRKTASTIPTVQEISAGASGPGADQNNSSSQVRGDSILEGLDAQARGQDIIASQMAEAESVKRGLDRQYAIEQRHAERMQALRDGRRNGVIESQAELDALIIASTQQRNEELAQIEQQRFQLMTDSQQQALGSLGDAFGNFAQIAKEGGKDSFNEYKAFASAQAAISASLAAIRALAEGGPFLGPILAASIGGLAAVQIANIQSQEYAGQAHDGIDKVPNSGTWNLEKGERVMTAQTSAKLDRKLDNMQDGASVAPQLFVNIHEDASKAGMVEQRQRPDGGTDFNVFVSDIYQGGPRSKALEAAYGLQRQGR